MTKEIITGLALLLLIIAGTTLIPAGYPQADQDVQLNGAVEVVNPYSQKVVSEVILGAEIPEYPGQAMVYRTVDTIVSEKDALDIAEKFGMSGPVEESLSGRNYVIRDDPYTFEIEKETGYMTYTWYGRWSDVDPRDRPENLPADEESQKIAETFLKSRDLMPEDAVYGGITHSEGFGLYPDNDTSVQTYKDSNVLFTGRLNNLPVVGTGITVTVGGDGDILRVCKSWRESEPYMEFDILSPEEAVEGLKETGVVTDVRSPERATVTEIRLCYYASPPGDEQPYLKPTYKIKGTVEGESGTGTFFSYLPAVPELGKGLY